MPTPHPNAIHTPRPQDEECFVVRHFAGDVCYSSAGFLEKNSDLLPPQFETKIKESEKEFVKKLVSALQVPRSTAHSLRSFFFTAHSC